MSLYVPKAIAGLGGQEAVMSSKVLNSVLNSVNIYQLKFIINRCNQILIVKATVKAFFNYYPRLTDNTSLFCLLKYNNLNLLIILSRRLKILIFIA